MEAFFKKELFEKLELLERCLSRFKGVSVSLSSGVDSSLLLFLARRFVGKVVPIYGDSCIRPGRFLEDACDISRSMGLGLVVVRTHETRIGEFSKNGPERCYVCKKELYGKILSVSKGLGLDAVLDGTVLDDLSAERPGLKALKELGILSPFLDVGITKKDVRSIARYFELPFWDKPSDSCLATRVPKGKRIDELTLRRIEKAEESLRLLGFVDFRLRDYGVVAILELRRRGPELPVIPYLLRWGYKVLIKVKRFQKPC